MFIDASALTAILAAEEGSAELVARLEAATVRMTSPLAVWETTVAIARVFALPIVEAAEFVDRYIGRVGIAVVPVPPETAAIALDAFARYGTGRRRLNFGDCFAYACARHLGQPLLFKGEDFTSTDVPAAWRRRLSFASLQETRSLIRDIGEPRPPDAERDIGRGDHEQQP